MVLYARHSGPRLLLAAMLLVMLAAVGPWGGTSASPLDPGHWERRAPLLTDRSEVAGAVVGDRIYVVGGLSPSTIADTVEEYDPVSDHWQMRAPLPHQVHHPAAASMNGKLYVIGGYVARLLSIWNGTDTVYEYDPATNRWRGRAPMPTPRGALAAVVVEGRIYAVGGKDRTDTGALEVYDPAGDSWKRLRPMPTPRNHIAAEVVDGRIYVFGGRTDHTGGNVGVTEMYDPHTDTWQERAPMPTSRSGIGAAALGGKVYVPGGELGRPGTYPENEEYDPAADLWMPRAPMLTPRHGLAVVAFRGRLYALSGGPRPGGHYSNVNEVYIPPP